MPIPFSCPHCGLETLVDDHYAGKSGPCAGCNKSIAVPFMPQGQRLDEHEVVVGIAARRYKSTWTVALVIGAALIAGVAVVATLMILFLPAVSAVRSIAQRHSCDANLKRIGLALQAYEARHGALPPAYIADADGNPMHSWRVLLLPFLDQQSLYQEYDFNQPWDSPQNQRLVNQMPSVYACPADTDAAISSETSYLVITGQGTLFPGDTPQRTRQISDERATTIAVVEAPVSGINWLEPRDLNAEGMRFKINGSFATEIGSKHEGGAHVLMADGSVRFLRDTTPSDFVQGMATINGGEPIPYEVLDDATP